MTEYQRAKYSTPVFFAAFGEADIVEFAFMQYICGVCARTAYH